MGIFLYALILIIFMIPLRIRAYLSVKRGRSPLPHFQNNVVVAQVKTRMAMGAFAPILFWTFHSVYIIAALADDAWIAALAAIVYMVVSTMLSAQIKTMGIHVIPEVATPRDPGT